MISIRSGMGLGDSLYLQSVVRHFVGKGQKIEACSAWPDVFMPLGAMVKVSPFRRNLIDRLAHYAMRRGVIGTTKFDDCCIQAGICERVDLRLDWKPINADLINSLRSVGKPIIVVQMPRAPFGDRTDRYGIELLPDWRRVQRAIELIGSRAFIVQIGSGQSLHSFSGIDLNLANKTSVCDLLDVGWVAGAFLGYCSFIIPLSESFSKPALLVWSRRGL